MYFKRIDACDEGTLQFAMMNDYVQLDRTDRAGYSTQNFNLTIVELNLLLPFLTEAAAEFNRRAGPPIEALPAPTPERSPAIVGRRRKKK
jgi:hypothetical protein